MIIRRNESLTYYLPGVSSDRKVKGVGCDEQTVNCSTITNNVL